MRNKNKITKASDKALLANLKKEMAEPRMSESAQIELKKRHESKG